MPKGLSYACFISYSHTQGKLGRTFVDQIKEGLEDELGPYTHHKIFLDTERLKGGQNIDSAVPRALCESACMIVVYSPVYEKSSYCLREFLAMERIEQARVRELCKSSDFDKANRMIIPIILRGTFDTLPDKLKVKNLYIDFTKYSLFTQKIAKSKHYSPKIREIAEHINYHFEYLTEMEDLPTDCLKFNLPSENVARQKWIPGRRRLYFPGGKQIGQ